MPHETKRLESLRIDEKDRSSSRSGGRIWWGLLLLIPLAATGWFLSGGETPPEVRTAKVLLQQGGDSSPVLDASGYVTARRQATVSSEITAQVVELLFEEGSRVDEGQLLARLDDSLLLSSLEVRIASHGAAESALAETQVLLAEARRELQRAENLAAEKIVGQAALDSATAGVDVLSARLAREREQIRVAAGQVELGRAQLEQTRIRAPFRGVAISKDAQPGEMVSPISGGGGFTRTGICTLVDMESLEIEVDVGESYIGRVSADQPVEAVLNAYPDWKIPGRVITLVPAADRQRATVRVRIGFDALDPRILPDMGVRVTFLSIEQTPEEEAEQTAGRSLMIPRAALLEQNGQTIVFVLRASKVERRAVASGKSRRDLVQILSGLTENEVVVLDPPGDLADGSEVR